MNIINKSIKRIDMNYDLSTVRLLIYTEHLINLFEFTDLI